MKQEDKELLLLHDICARLPYGVKIDVTYSKDSGSSLRERLCYEGINILTTNILWLFQQSEVYIKPYLFPLSSMTQEQKIECFKGTDIELDEHNEIWSTFPISNSDIVLTNLDNWLKVINWLNKNNFDYRGLIPMGLAIDATNLNIY